MADETIVAVYDTAAHAEAAIRDLRAANVPEGAIDQHAGTTTTGTATTGMATGSTYNPAAPVRERGFWSSLFGGETEDDTAVYDRSLHSGSTVVTVKVPEMHVARVMEILESHHPVDIDERAASYGLTQTTTTTRAPMAPLPTTGVAATTGMTQATGTDGVIQLAEESLVVGKRMVNRGGTRIRRFVVETPVEEQVTLRDEKVMVERRPVTDGRPVGDVDFSEKTIEMTESAEEAVVGKTTRVVEEVNLRKEATERVETVRDTVRREDVKIEQGPGERVAGTTTTTGTTTTGTTGPVMPTMPAAPKV